MCHMNSKLDKLSMEYFALRLSISLSKVLIHHELGHLQDASKATFKNLLVNIILDAIFYI